MYVQHHLWAWKSVLGNDRNSPRSNEPAATAAESLKVTATVSPFLTEYRVSVLCVFSLAAKASHPQSCVIFHPPFCTDTHVIWSEIHGEGAGWERRGIYMHSARETRVFILLHTCVFNFSHYQAPAHLNMFNIYQHYMDNTVIPETHCMLGYLLSTSKIKLMQTVTPLTEIYHGNQSFCQRVKAG